ncbi:MAG: lipid II flippase MurJ, partial [Chloroflexota bacterium]
MTSTDTPSQQTSELPSIARAASVIALGNIASRALGLIRETVKAHLFGASGQVDALNIALILPIQIYELVTGGIVNSALVPVFSDYAAPERRAELWRLVSTLLTLLTVLLAIPLLGLEILTPLLARAVGGGFDETTLNLAASLLRITLPGVLFLSLSGVISGLLYSLKRFTAPAFTASVFNAAMVACALLFAARWGVRAMAVGLFVGAVVQVVIQFPALRDALAHLRPALHLNHPGLRRILRLYLPIIFGLIITQASIYIGLNLASRTG